jgi:L-rhamnose mutarotase
VTTRVCFQLQVDADRIDEYRERHRAVWPEMLREIAASGRRNYSIFLRPDGLLIGYYETDDPIGGDRYLAQSSVAAEWEAHMGDIFAELGGRADQVVVELQEVFHLEDQLDALGALDD